MSIALQFMNEPAPKRLDQFYIIVQSVQSLQWRNWYPFGRQDNWKQNFLSCIFTFRIFSVPA